MPPKSRLPPVQTKGLKFGSGSSSQPSSVNSNSMSKEQKKKIEEEGGLPFLDYICCNVCNEPFFDGIEKGRVFWMTSCAHIICNSEEHEHKEGICTVCGKKMQAVTMEEGNLQPHQEKFLSNPESQFEQLIAEAQAFQEKMKTLKSIYKYQINQHKKPRSLYKIELDETRVSLDKARAEIDRLRNELDVHILENVELKVANKELQARLDMPPPAINGYTTPRQPLIPGSQYAQRLSIVQEEDEEGDIGQRNHATQSVLGKRQRVGSAEEQPKSYIPSTPIMPPQHYSQLLGNSNSLQPQPRPERPGVGEYATPVMTPAPLKPELERYRFNCTPLNGAGPQSFSQGYRSVQNTPMQRPTSVLGAPIHYAGGNGIYEGRDDTFGQGNRMVDQNYQSSRQTYQNDPYVYQSQYEQREYQRDQEPAQSSDVQDTSEGREGGKFVMSNAPKRPIPPPF